MVDFLAFLIYAGGAATTYRSARRFRRPMARAVMEALCWPYEFGRAVARGFPRTY